MIFSTNDIRPRRITAIVTYVTVKSTMVLNIFYCFTVETPTLVKGYLQYIQGVS